MGLCGGKLGNLMFPEFQFEVKLRWDKEKEK